MNILYLTYHGLSEHSGISKKMIAQVEGLRQNGHDVHFCTYIIDEQGQRKRMVNDTCIENYGTGTWAKIKKRFCYGSIVRYAKEHNIKFVYIRSFNNANPMTVRLVRKLKKAGMKVVMEIPTYPYDKEYDSASWRIKANLFIDKLFRKQLAKKTDRIVTFSDVETIFGQKTIRISNGIDFEQIPIRFQKSPVTNEIHLIGVAEVHYWHGFDRLIAGIGKYNQQYHDVKVHFHIVGGIGNGEMNGNEYSPGFKPFIDKYNIDKYIHFHGQMYGDNLNKLFEKCDFAIGSLGRHRTGIDKIKTLKNREYAARGIPFIYSETDEDFEHMPYILKAPADESPININRLLDFYLNNQFDANEIRNSIKHLSWKEQMKKVLDEIYQS